MFARTGNERGVVLLTVTILILTLAMLGSAFLLSSVGNSRLTVQQAQLARAGTIAGSGVDLALYDLAYNGAVFGNTWDIADYHGGALHVESRAQIDAQGVAVTQKGIIVSRATVNGVTSTVEATVYNDTHQVHELFFKSVYAGNRWGLPGNYVEFAGVNHNQHDYCDNITGDIHIEGEIRLGGDASAHRFGKLECTGDIVKYNLIGLPANMIGGGHDDSIQPPDLAAQGYDRAAREYRSWDAGWQGTGRDVVNVGNEYAHYQNLGQMKTFAIACEDSSAWNYSATSPPDNAMANFFQWGYQNHYTKTFESADDTRMTATKNYYLGARNGGDASHYGNNAGGGLYGGGHSVITITPEQNNKVYYVDGNVWIDSDGDNHIFFVPGAGVDKVNITIVAKGNIYIGDQVFITSNTVDSEQYSRNIGGSTSDAAYRMTDPDSGLALVAMRDGESFNDLNKNGKYDVGETVIGREIPTTPEPAGNNPSSTSQYSTGYRGRMEGSGNIIMGDTICGPVGVVEAFMFAENNFMDITSDTSQGSQRPYFFGNMTAGNTIFLNRYYANWLSETSWQVNDKPANWTYHRTIDGNDCYFPPGTTDSNYNNPLVTYRRMYASGNKWNVQLAEHGSLDLKYDDRIEDGIMTLPGLPSAVSTIHGSWKIVVWKQY